MKARNHLRVPIPIPVRIKVVDMDQDFRFATLGDISWGGAFIMMDPPAPVGSRIIIQFMFSDESVSLELWSNVVRSRDKASGKISGVGVQFDSLDYDAQTLIQTLVHEEILDLVKNV